MATLENNTALTLKEVVDNRAPSDAGFSSQGGKAKAVYLLQQGTGTNQAIAPADLQTALTQILGTVNMEPGDGRLQRTPPLAHPVYPWLYASAITNIQGIGKYTLTNSNKELDVPPISQFALYTQYQFTVEFTPRPYAVLLDSDINLYKNKSWYNDAGSSTTFKYAGEWIRYTDYEVHAQPQTLTAKQGQMLLRTGSGTPPNNNPFAAMPKLYVPDSLIKFTWYQVPFRYYESANSYIAQYMGRVNQNDWYGWDAGTLLYLSANPKRYTPPVPQMDEWDEGAFSTAKLCDIEFTFLETARVGTDVPAGGVRANLDSNNPNWVMAGHNLQPWLTTRKFYYATTDPKTGQGNQPCPAWYSFPFEMLFTDPDV